MKQITAVFQPHRLEQVEQAMHTLPHLPGFTIFPARGHARGHGIDRKYTAEEWNPDSHDRFVLIVYCSDEHAPKIAEAIRSAASTGRHGDGIIAITDVSGFFRIHTGESGESAV